MSNQTDKRLDALESAIVPVCDRCGQPLVGAALERAKRQAAAEKNPFNGNEFAKDFARLTLGDRATEGELAELESKEPDEHQHTT
jgi:hypothetical protein